MKIIHSLLLAALLAAGVAQAQTVTPVPSSPTVMPGDLFTVDLVVSGLGDTPSSTLGAFDLDFVYEPALLRFYGVVFGDGLDVLDLGSLFSVSSSPGLISIFQTSFDSIDDLVALQPNSFTLATLSFKAIGQGISPLELFVNAFGDAQATSMPVEPGAGSVTSVPEPEAWALMLAGLGLTVVAARRS